MPFWIKWVGERFLHVLIYGVIILGIGFMLYSAFLKPTNTTTNTGEVKYYWQGAKQTTFGCAHFDGQIKK